MGADERIGLIDLHKDLLVAAAEVSDEVVDMQGEPDLRELMLVRVEHA
jgi:hypothetical protein